MFRDKIITDNFFEIKICNFTITKMSDYPDPDEEYELMYADEYELLREAEENEGKLLVQSKCNLKKRTT